MPLLRELQDKSDKKFNEQLDQFVKEITPQLEESAAKGYRGFKIRMDDTEGERSVFLHDSKLVSELKKKFEGFKISIEDEIWGSTYIKELRSKRKYLYIRWSE